MKRSFSGEESECRWQPGAWLVIVGMVLPSLVTWIYFVWLNRAPASYQQGAYSLGKLIQFSLPLVWWWLSRPRPPVSLRVNAGVGWGLALGTAIAVAMVGLYAGVLGPLGVFGGGPQVAMTQKVSGLGLTSPARYMVLGVFYALAHAGLEEFYWRWFVFGDLQRRMRLVPAATISSMGFMAHHVLLMAHYFGWHSPWTYLFSLSVAIGGFLWALLYHRWQSLLGPWLSHMLVDAAIFVIGYYLVSSAWG